MAGVMAGTPAAKLFSLLEVLQARPSATGAELAEALGVTERTLRRYVQRLVDLGIPVDSERGPYGGYRLRPRFRLPPLMLTADEAVAVTLGLVVGQRLGVGAAVPAAAAALAKLLRVLPDPLRERVAALQDSLGVVVPPQRGADVDPSVLADLGAAAGLRRRVRFVHRSAGGNDRQRSVDPYGVVFHAGRWYLVGHDHLRADLRTFRLDRLRDVTTTGERFTPPDDFDPVAHLVRSLAEVPYGWDVEVVLHIDIEAARRLIAPTVGTIEPHPQGALLRVGAESPQSAARHLMMMGVPFTVIRPDEVRQALRDLAAEALKAATATLYPGSTGGGSGESDPHGR
ncbi:YafY family protein [soil metagenome]|jgi:predicted DNA-binding transcriptional regulator YafY